jgi:hypothetical protein
MANFQASAFLPQGFDTPNYTLASFPDNARFACLSGGDPNGNPLDVVALTTADPPSPANPPSPLVKLLEDSARAGNDDPDFKLDHVRRFRVYTTGTGQAFLHALQPAGAPGAGQDYSNPLQVTIGANRGDLRVMTTALDASRRTLRTADTKLADLQNALELLLGSGRIPTPDQQATFAAVKTWLRVTATMTSPFANTGEVTRARTVITRARALIQQNLALTDIDLMRTPEGVYGRGPVGDSTKGMECGEAFFSHGPNCQRDVMTHEYFHMVGLGHGEVKGQAIPSYADRNIVNTPDLALNSADNLAQMVCQLNGGATDACTRDAD